jgi:hypothetical protein
LAGLREIAELPVSQPVDCPQIGDLVEKQQQTTPTATPTQSPSPSQGPTPTPSPTPTPIAMADVKSVSTLFSIIGLVPPPAAQARTQFFFDAPVETLITHTIHNNGEAVADVDVEFKVELAQGDFNFVLVAASADDDCYNVTVLVPCMEGTPGTGPLADNCLDGLDNDGDTLVDSSDPDCAANISRLIVHLNDVPTSVLVPVHRKLIATCELLGTYEFTVTGTAFAISAEDPTSANDSTNRIVKPPGYPTCVNLP